MEETFSRVPPPLPPPPPPVVIVVEPPPCSSIYLSIVVYFTRKLEPILEEERGTGGKRPTEFPVFPSSFASLIEFQRVAGIRKWTSWFELCVPPSSLSLSPIFSAHKESFFPSSFHQMSARKLLTFSIRVSSPGSNRGGRGGVIFGSHVHR